jgi:superfamily II DNA or RNA helicase
MNDFEQRIATLEQKIQTIDVERDVLFQELSELKYQLRQRHQKELRLLTETATVTQQSYTKDKINLFRDLFKGREDVYPKRFVNSKTGKSGYAPVCSNEWKPGVCEKPRIKCTDCQYRSFLPVNDQVISNHLTGVDNHRNQSADFVIGIYPLMIDDRCWFLAVDFDKASWQLDVSAFAETCKVNSVPYSIEISRSGKGAHVWLFFSQPVFAIEARKLGSYLLTLAMDKHPSLDFESYDRLFPNQDTMPKGGFGNLIALPLQKKPREDEDEPWKIKPSRKIKEVVINESLPKSVTITLSNQLFIDITNIPTPLQSRIIRLAAFQNPDFYKAQAMRMSTFGKPRVISCAEYYSQHIALPRGCQDELISLFDELKIKAVIQDERFAGQDIGGIAFQGQLTDEQNLAVNKLLEHDIGTLSATTAFGKTVVALNILAKRQVNTLIIVHRRQLLDQWLERIELFLNVTKKQVGKIGGGKNKPTGVIDVAIIQSLTKNQSVADLVANYGQVIFDECHHLSAVSFEMVAKACKAKYVLGLSATLTRKDGHHPIVFMQCGAVRHQVSAKKQALARPFEHYVTQRHTVFMTPENNFPVTLSIHDVYQALVVDVERNQFIIEDIKKALAQGRSPLILTERREHVMLLAEQISKFAKNVVVMQGGMGIRQRKQVQDILQNIPDTEERVIIATGRYLGEGFDDARLDTLFLVMPISWKGTLAQYVGRLHRLHHLKTEVRIYDYVDIKVPMLSKMSEKRKVGYKALGYTMVAEEL